jgi:hypothetical protein
MFTGRAGGGMHSQQSGWYRHIGKSRYINSSNLSQTVIHLSSEDDLDSSHGEPKALPRNDEYRPPPAQPPPLPHHLHPQLSPSPYAMYDPSHTNSGPVSQFYYTPQQHMMGPGQPPHMMQTYLSEQRTTYYPVIDPSIDDSGPSNSSVMFSGRANHP